MDHMQNKHFGSKPNRSDDERTTDVGPGSLDFSLIWWAFCLFECRGSLQRGWRVVEKVILVADFVAP